MLAVLHPFFALGESGGITGYFKMAVASSDGVKAPIEIKVDL